MVAEFYTFECGDITTVVLICIVSLYKERAQTGNITALEAQHYQPARVRSALSPPDPSSDLSCAACSPKPPGPKLWSIPSLVKLHPRSTVNCDSSNIQSLCLMREICRPLSMLDPIPALPPEFGVLNHSCILKLHPRTRIRAIISCDDPDSHPTVVIGLQPLS